MEDVEDVRKTRQLKSFYRQTSTAKLHVVKTTQTTSLRSQNWCWMCYQEERERLLNRYIMSPSQFWVVLKNNVLCWCFILHTYSIVQKTFLGKVRSYWETRARQVFRKKLLNLLEMYIFTIKFTSSKWKKQPNPTKEFTVYACACKDLWNIVNKRRCLVQDSANVCIPPSHKLIIRSLWKEPRIVEF